MEGKNYVGITVLWVSFFSEIASKRHWTHWIKHEVERQKKYFLVFATLRKKKYIGYENW